MARAVEKHAAGASLVLMAAAVSDYRPAEAAPQKLKKGPGPMSLPLVRTPDILRALGEVRREGQLLVGFAAETESLREHARRKLREKRLDLIVSNDVSRPDAGFGTETNRAVLLDAAGGEEELPLLSKQELAERILDRVVALRREVAAGTGARKSH
jgi:phosphopantothenoylcysteine decarboxylase/phosphopantothenate--cysteine ligase